MIPPEALGENMFFTTFFQLLITADIPWLVVPLQYASTVTLPPPLLYVSLCLPLIRTLWLHLGPTWMIQNNLKFLNLIESAKSFPGHTKWQFQVPMTGMWISYGVPLFSLLHVSCTIPYITKLFAKPTSSLLYALRKQKNSQTQNM